jgi:glycosyltransferase 2 family protein
MQRYRNRIFVGIILVLAIYIGLLLVLDSSGQFTEGVVRHLGSFPLWLLAPLIILQLGAAFFRFLEWHYFLGVIEARHKISLLDSAVIFISAFTMVVSPGKVAEVVKSVLLKMKTGVPVFKSAPVILAERVVDGLAVIVTVLLTLLIAGNRLELGEYRAMSQTVIFTAAIGLGAGLIVVQIAPLAYFCLGLLERMPLLHRLHRPLTDFYESSREIFKIRHVIPTTMMGMGVYLCSTIGFVLVLWGFGLEITWTLFLQAAFIVGVVSAIGALSFVPNGAGITEISSAALILAVIAPVQPEMTPAAAAAAALVQGFFHKWFRVVFGLSVAVVYRKRLFTAELDEELDRLEQSKQPAYGVERA